MIVAVVFGSFAALKHHGSECLIWQSDAPARTMSVRADRICAGRRSSVLSTKQEEIVNFLRSTDIAEAWLRQFFHAVFAEALGSQPWDPTVTMAVTAPMR